jgi:hypothetical protein
LDIIQKTGERVIVGGGGAGPASAIIATIMSLSSLR